MLEETVAALRSEATAVDERRVLVLAGDRSSGLAAAEDALAATDIPRRAVTAVGDDDRTHFPTRSQDQTAGLLGTTHEAIVLDCHRTCRPNVLGRLVGAVDGGGLLVLVTPRLAEWPARHDEFDDHLVAPPATVSDVGDRFRSRLVRTLRAHRGIAIADVDEGTILDDGRTDPAPRIAGARGSDVERPSDTETIIPSAAYDACLTEDQVEAVSAFDALREGPAALVVEADRGRGKSSAAGLAAAAYAAQGESVLVSAPNYRNAAEGFERAAALLTAMEEIRGAPDSRPRDLETAAGGRVWFEPAAEAGDVVESADLVVVDEAASLPVRVLESFLSADRIAFATTVHGYEGAGRGFDVRFRSRLADGRHAVDSVRLEEPIRYAAGDPVEVWAFRALLLDASPAVDPLLEDADPASARYASLSQRTLAERPHLLREVFGLLVAAHYRTDPDDLARVLDAPNLSVRALLVDGHVASVALLAQEGNLSSERRAAAYEGGRIRGNMIPDVLMSQLRDESAGALVGQRVMRIATHAAIRERGFGSRLLAEIREEFTDVDWLGTGFGATPGLLEFWAGNGYESVHLSTTRNRTSGEYSAIMLDPVSRAGRRLHERHSDWFVDRIGSQLPGVLTRVDPAVVAAVMRSSAGDVGLELDDRSWRLLVGAAYGPALYSVDPGPFARLVRWHFVTGESGLLTDREERLLVRAVLQRRDWSDVADELDYPGRSAAMRALGDALVPLVEEYAPADVLTERARY
ncbi:MAG: tRNA(Met) cytidine acetyltransferase TmcA [Halanaeroarchaeum sp.]